VTEPRRVRTGADLTSSGVPAAEMVKSAAKWSNRFAGMVNETTSSGVSAAEMVKSALFRGNGSSLELSSLELIATKVYDP